MLTAILSSVAAIIGIIFAVYIFPPNLTLEDIQVKGKYNFDARLIIKNLGKLPAYNVVLDVISMNLTMNGITLQNNNMINCGIPTKRLVSDEKMEQPACPHVEIPVGTSLNSCDYKLKLKYDFRFLWFSKTIEKYWHIELRSSEDDFVWNHKML